MFLPRAVDLDPDIAVGAIVFAVTRADTEGVRYC